MQKEWILEFVISQAEDRIKDFLRKAIDDVQPGV